jgi:hypothetical protein
MRATIRSRGGSDVRSISWDVAIAVLLRGPFERGTRWSA